MVPFPGKVVVVVVGFELIVVVSMLIPFAYGKNANDEGWGWIEELPEMDGSHFKEAIYPIIQMAANAYRYPSSVPIPGWNSASLVPPSASPHGGLHALAYQEESESPSSRIAIAFRGTQISSTQDALADICADMLLWDGLDFESLPFKCSIFTNSTLDYFSQALAFTKQVLEAYPGYPLLLTGHSLGAGLSILVSAALSENIRLPVIGFGAPGTKTPLQKRSLHLTAADEGKVFVIGDEWDEIMRTSWEGQVGILCIYQTIETDACIACLSKSSFLDAGYRISRLSLNGNHLSIENPFPEGNDCMECFYQTHYLKSLMKLVKRGDKPICQQGPSKDGGAGSGLYSTNIWTAHTDIIWKDTKRDSLASATLTTIEGSFKPAIQVLIPNESTVVYSNLHAMKNSTEENSRN